MARSAATKKALLKFPATTLRDSLKGIELFDVKKDPGQYTNLAKNPEYTQVVERFKNQMTERLEEVRNNDLGLTYRKGKVVD